MPKLAGFGLPADFHDRQVTRWSRQLASYDGQALDDLAEVGPWLLAHRPQAWTPALMHGDYHMLNLLVADGDPVRVTAVLDWETATIGDPMLDPAGLAEVWRLVCDPVDG